MMSLLAFDRHNLNATLTRRSHGYTTAVRLYSHGNLVGFLHWGMTRSGWVVMLLLASSIDLARCHRSRLTIRREACNGTGTSGIRKTHARSSEVVADHGWRWSGCSREVGSAKNSTYNGRSGQRWLRSYGIHTGRSSTGRDEGRLMGIDSARRRIEHAQTLGAMHGGGERASAWMERVLEVPSRHRILMRRLDTSGTADGG